MEKKTNKILELKHQLNNTRSNLIIPCGLIGISVCYLILAHNRYADYASFIFTSTNSTISKLKILDFGIIMLLIISYILLRSKIAKYNNLKFLEKILYMLSIANSVIVLKNVLAKIPTLNTWKIKGLI
ncbi:hypothetical protein [Clostridium cochlearium]|uniref:hypothetical protein n=1 Tax=Clostridium cochlearium TaxID=1494 RepID=UPI001C0F3163|nr:hypothetical protein [Clostridium cochlearium]MBU5269399.1 hypothetical protein [Clostridium cochlearium]